MNLPLRVVQSPSGLYVADADGDEVCCCARDGDAHELVRRLNDEGNGWSLVEALADTLDTILPYVYPDTYEKMAEHARDIARAALGGEGA